MNMTDQHTPANDWRKCFRDGFAPQLSADELDALAVACETDDPRLVQGCTTFPLPEHSNAGEAVERGCMSGYVGAIRHGGFACSADAARAVAFSVPVPVPTPHVPITNYTPATVGDCEEEFAQMCFKADELLGEPAACRWFLNWFDDTPREQMLKELGAECRNVLAARAPSLV